MGVWVVMVELRLVVMAWLPPLLAAITPSLGLGINLVVSVCVHALFGQSFYTSFLFLLFYKLLNLCLVCQRLQAEYIGDTEHPTQRGDLSINLSVTNRLQLFKCSRPETN